MNSIAKYMKDSGSDERAVRAIDLAQDQAVRALNEVISLATQARDAMTGDDVAAWNAALRTADSAGSSGTIQAKACAYVAACATIFGIANTNV